MNSSIHMLEALTGLYEVWPGARVKARLQEMFDILRDKVVADPGYLVQFLSADWKPRASDDSYGHDVETSYLLVEAAAALGMPDDARTWAAARKLVDHALAAGWDKSLGGLYNSGNIEGGNYAAAREWWVQAEMLNALLLMHEHFGKDNPQYWKAFVAQWDWINQHGLDPVNGGWWPLVKNDGSPVHGTKSNNWTECYHQGRALLNVSARLRHLAETTGSK
jgi:mannobiose 2-epimerase